MVSKIPVPTCSVFITFSETVNVWFIFGLANAINITAFTGQCSSARNREQREFISMLTLICLVDKEINVPFLISSILLWNYRCKLNFSSFRCAYALLPMKRNQLLVCVDHVSKRQLNVEKFPCRSTFITC